MDTMDVPTYSREMGGIRSDGQLYELQRRMQQEPSQQPPQEQAREEPVQETMAHPAPPPPPKAPDRGGFLNLSFLRDLKMDDLLLLAIGFLLLTDSGQERNDLLFLLIGLLLLF